MDAKNVLFITLDRYEGQKLLNIIDEIHEQFKKGDHPDIQLLLKFADVLEHALTIEG